MPASRVTAARTPQLTSTQDQPLNWVVGLLMLSLVIPIHFSFGSLRMSPNRMILVVMILPLLVSWLSGACGRIRTADILIVLSSLWIAISLLVYGGTTMIENLGITGIEMIAPYLLARRYIRTEAQYLALIRIFRWIALILAPLAAIEAILGIRLMNSLFDPFFSTFGTRYDSRWGMARAAPGFEHPILFGCFTAFLFSPVYFALRQKMGAVWALVLASPVLFATFFALSVGAYLGLIIQLLLIGWGFAMRRVPGRWQILAILVTLAFITVDLISNRTPFEVFITYLTFNAGSGFWRVLIFTYGIENVWAHPIFGLGLGDWARPAFMFTSSVDNYWLLMAMRHGIPGFLLIAATFIAVLTALMRARPAAASVRAHRIALMFSFLGLILALATVHIWNATLVFVMFMLGAGAWISDAPQVDKATRAGDRGEPPQKDRAGASHDAPGAFARQVTPAARRPTGSG